MSVAALLLVGGAAVLAVQIGTKVVEGFELMFGARCESPHKKKDGL